VNIDIDEQKSQIPSLREKGHIVICYFSAGTIEPWRADCKANESLWKSAEVGKMADWDESWLDVRKLKVLQDLMSWRMMRAATQGCHEIEFDNIDCYENKDCYGKMTSPSVPTGQSILPQQLTYNRWLASYAHSLGLATAHKNALGLVNDLVSHFDFAINEECQRYDECAKLRPYLNANKAVFNVEYSARSAYCSGGRSLGLMTKYCSGSNGLCRSGSWTNCFKPANPLPPTLWKNHTELD